MSELTIIPIPAFKDNYIWLLFRSQPGECIIVDPGDAKPVITTLKKMQLTPCAIFITHHHHDHTGGVNELLSHYPVPVYGPEKEAMGITHPVNEASSVTIESLSLKFNVLDIPGHTLGHIAYFLPNTPSLFCGDTLFLSGCGRLFEGTAKQMFHSLKKIKRLPAETKIYCGHEYTLANLEFARQLEPDNLDLIQRQNQVSTLRENNKSSVPGTLADELLLNPFLKTHSPEIKLSIKAKTGTLPESELETFALLRDWKDHY